MEDRCVVCGGYVPEGCMACINCRNAEPNFNTVKITVLLNKVRDVLNFVRLASKCRDNVMVRSGYNSVNAKSLFGVFSLDLSKPLKVEFYGAVPYEVREGMKKFIIN